MSLIADHPLTRPQHLSALSVAALFWALGVALIDPRKGVGLCLCGLGAILTVWIYWSDFMYIRNLVTWRKLPWLGIGLVFVELSVPGYMLCARAEEPDAKTSIQEVIAKGLCPPGTQIMLENNEASNNGTGYEISGNLHVCLLNSKEINNGKGYKIE